MSPNSAKENRPQWYWAIVLLIAISCNESGVLSVKTHEVDYLNRTADIQEGKPAMEIMGVDNIIVFDTLFMAVTNNPDGQLQIYSTNTMKHLGSFCKRGRARNEFLDVSAQTEQLYYRNGHLMLAMFDMYSQSYDINMAFKEVDITESLRQGSTVVSDTHECLADGELLILNEGYSSRFEFEMYLHNEETDRILPRYTVFDNGDSVNLKIFNGPMKTETKNKKLPYVGNLKKHPERNLVVQSFQRLDYLLYMDIDAGKYFMVHQKGAPTFDDTYVSRDMYHSVHFSEGAASSKYLMFLYRHGDYTLSTTQEQFYPELLVFDWDGNYITGFKTNRSFTDIEFDEIHNVLYALDRYNEQLFAFDMSPFLPQKP